MKKTTEKTVQKFLIGHILDVFQHKIAVPNNTTLFWWESDVISVTSSGLFHEYEIKVSEADLNAELKRKKGKHARIINRIKSPNYFWFVTYGFSLERFEEKIFELSGWLSIEDVDYYPFYKVVNKKSAPRLHTDKATIKDYEKISRSLSYRVRNFYERYIT